MSPYGELQIIVRGFLNNENTYYPLLFDANLALKPAYFGAILDDSIPVPASSEAIAEAIGALELTEQP